MSAGDWIPPPAGADDEPIEEYLKRQELQLIGLLPLIQADEDAPQALPKWVRKSLRPVSTGANGIRGGKCPFCKQSGFLVQPLVWRCTTCRREGTVIDFYCAMDGLSRLVALRYLFFKCLTDHLT